MSYQQRGSQLTIQQELTRLVQQASGHGQSLDEGLRRTLEHSIGVDLSGLRLHTGDLAYRLTNLLGSKAATANRHIFIPQTSYRPSTRDGLHLLAHEAAHAVQQAQGVGQEPNMGIVATPGSYWELEAEAVAARVLAGATAPANRFTPPAAQLSAKTFIQGFNSWEHTLLGDADRRTLVTIAKRGEGWQQIVQQWYNLVALWKDNPNGVTEATLVCWC